MKKLVFAVLVGGAAAWAVTHQAPAITATAAPQVAVTVGNIYSQGADISIHNGSSVRLSSVFLHCTFRDANGSRIDSVPVLVSDLAPYDTAKEKAQTPKHATIDKVDCLTEHAL